MTVPDARQTARRLRHDWRFTIPAVLLLGLAIGVTTAVFSLVNAVLFRGPAAASLDRLVNVYQDDRAGRPLVVTSVPTYDAIAAFTDLFEATAAASLPRPVRYLQGGALRDGVAEFATATYPDVLRIRPAIGRWFDQREERPGAPPVAVLGHDVWARAFNADPAAVGQVVRIEGIAVTIVGVGPRSHRATTDVGVATDFWLPVGVLAALRPPAPEPTSIQVPLLVKARLREGIDVRRAQAAMGVLGRRLAAESLEAPAPAGELVVGSGISVVAAADVRVHPQADAAVAGMAALVLGLAGLVLAIACSNLATLLLVRGAARAREFAVRQALGATPAQVVGQLLSESLLLSLAGGTLGCLLAWWGTEALRAIDLPLHVDVALDARVLTFGAALSIGTGLAFGVAPARAGARPTLLPAMRDEDVLPLDARRLTLKHALIVVQVAVSVLLLGATSVVLQMGAAARALDVGYAVDGVAMIETDLRFSDYSDTEARSVLDRLQRRIQGLPGVESVTLQRGLPMEAATVPIVLDTDEGRPGADVEAAAIGAGPGFFDTLRIPLLHGRVFDRRDRADTPRVAVVTERMARRYFGGGDAVGRRFRRADDAGAKFEVIGVVADTGTGTFADDVLDPIAPAFYTCYLQFPDPPTTLLARTTGDAAALLAAMTGELQAIDAAVPVIGATTMAARLARGQAAPAALAALLGGLGAFGLALASIGLYAVVAFAVARRTREIGIRIALGARRRDVVAGTVRSVMGLVSLGTAAGLGLSALVVLGLGAASGDIGIGHIAVYRPRLEPAAFLAIAIATAVVGAGAALVPGRRAASVDPAVALRHD
ncbi:MAG: ADOP family duplicated permease [Vicinamibacterales bacterium]